MRPLLALPLLLLLLPDPLEAHLEVISLPLSTGAAGRQLLATNECVAKGLQGTCNGCVVSRGGAGPANTCARALRQPPRQLPLPAAAAASDAGTRSCCLV